jgi:hypothetical protein
MTPSRKNCRLKFLDQFLVDDLSGGIAAEKFWPEDEREPHKPFQPLGIMLPGTPDGCGNGIGIPFQSLTGVKKFNPTAGKI